MISNLGSHKKNLIFTGTILAIISLNVGGDMGTEPSRHPNHTKQLEQLESWIENAHVKSKSGSFVHCTINRIWKNENNGFMCRVECDETLDGVVSRTFGSKHCSYDVDFEKMDHSHFKRSKLLKLLDSLNDPSRGSIWQRHDDKAELEHPFSSVPSTSVSTDGGRHSRDVRAVSGSQSSQGDTSIKTSSSLNIFNGIRTFFGHRRGGSRVGGVDAANAKHLHADGQKNPLRSGSKEDQSTLTPGATLSPNQSSHLPAFCFLSLDSDSTQMTSIINPAPVDMQSIKFPMGGSEAGSSVDQTRDKSDAPGSNPKSGSAEEQKVKHEHHPPQPSSSEEKCQLDTNPAHPKINSVVWLNRNGERKRGTVMCAAKNPSGQPIFGIKLDNPDPVGTDGAFGGMRFFHCPDKCGVLTGIDEIETERSTESDDGQSPTLQQKEEAAVPAAAAAVPTAAAPTTAAPTTAAPTAAAAAEKPQNHQVTGFSAGKKPANQVKCPDIDINSRVHVEQVNKKDPLAGTVKWLGTDKNGQLRYGVVLDHPDPQGCRGVFDGEKLFDCQDKLGVLATPDKVTLKVIQPQMPQGSVKQAQHQKQNTEKVPRTCDFFLVSYAVQEVRDKPVPDDVYKRHPNLCLGARVTVERKQPVKGKGPWTGVLQWTGTADNIECAGIEFDDPVLSGTDGTFCGVKLFAARKGCAALVPWTLIMNILPPAASFRRSDIPKDQIQYPDLGIDSMVVAEGKNKRDMPGIIVWSGFYTDKFNFGIVLEQPYEDGTNGTFFGVRLFDCQMGHGILVAPKFVKPDLRYMEPQPAFRSGEIPETEVRHAELQLQSLVMVERKGNFVSGTLLWGGFDLKNVFKYGIALDDSDLEGTDGVFFNQQLFECSPRHGILAKPSEVIPHPDFHFGQLEEQGGMSDSIETIEYGVPPMQTPQLGRWKGIQGHQNSCYLDATLFSMFAYSPIFDSMLHQQRTKGDNKELQEQIRLMLKNKIVNVLRHKGSVKCQSMMELRILLDQLGQLMKVKGLTADEKDPEEVLNLLLTKENGLEPFLMFEMGDHKQESYLYQMFVVTDLPILCPTTQQLLEMSFQQSDLKFIQAPPCLILLTPRYGKEFRLFDNIVPSLRIELTHLIKDYPRPCTECKHVSTVECLDCYHPMKEGLAGCAYCLEHDKDVHELNCLQHRRKKKLKYPGDCYEHCMKPETLELAAVLCIETSHYVSFVRTGPESTSPWVFYDSMADRTPQNTNVPEVTEVPCFAEWLNEANRNPNDIKFPKNDERRWFLRLIRDCYMCIYLNWNQSCFV